MAGRRYDQRRLGEHGEELAAGWYESRGFTVLARNWRCREGELDLVVARDGLVVFCEVKARSGDRYGSPFEAVGPAKQARLRRLAARWLREEAPYRPAAVRFDVAGVVGTRVEVVESAL